MAAESNMGFQGGVVPSFFQNRHMLSFQSGAVNSSNNRVELAVPDPFTVPELKHDTGLAVFWSIEEQLLLEEGLAKYSKEPNITKYIKIASSLQNKTVRDVAFRCRWMTRENRRRRRQEHNGGKIMKDHKVKQVDSSVEGNSAPVSRPSNVPRSFAPHHPDCSTDGSTCEVSYVSCPMRQLLEENWQLLGQIKDNLDVLKVQENIRLVLHAKNNLTTVLDRMSKVAGLSQMSPLPLAVDESLFSKFLLLSPLISSLSPPEPASTRQEHRF